MEDGGLERETRYTAQTEKRKSCVVLDFGSHFDPDYLHMHPQLGCGPEMCSLSAS